MPRNIRSSSRSSTARAATVGPRSTSTRPRRSSPPAEAEAARISPNCAGAARQHSDAHVPRRRAAPGVGHQPRRHRRISAASPCCRVFEGTIRKGQSVAWCKRDGTISASQDRRAVPHRAPHPGPVDQARQGDLVAVAGIEEIYDRRDAGRPRRSPSAARHHRRRAGAVDDDRHQHVAARRPRGYQAHRPPREEPARRRSSSATSASASTRPIDPTPGRSRLAASCSWRSSSSRCAARVSSSTIGKPVVLTKEIDGKLHEPVERVTIDVPEEYLGAVTQLLAVRKGRMQNMAGSGWVRLDYLVPARGLIGFRTEFLTETRGTGVHQPHVRGLRAVGRRDPARQSGVLVADRSGPTTTYAMTNLQDRSTMMVGPGTEVYCGMIVGENSRAGDMDVNICKEKKLTNMRASSSDTTVTLTPHRAAVARRRARVHRRRRVRRGDAEEHPPAQGRPRPEQPRPRSQAPLPRQLTCRAGSGTTQQVATRVREPVALCLTPRNRSRAGDGGVVGFVEVDRDVVLLVDAGRAPGE